MTQTASMKRKRKAGRPRAEGDREPNGRLRRSTTPREAPDAMTIAVRARHAGVTAKDAKDPTLGTFIGLLRARGLADKKDPTGISHEQYESLTAYAALHADFERAIGAPGAGISSEGRAGGSEISDGYIRWCSKARQRFEEAKAAIALEQEGNRTDNLWAALDLCVRQNQKMWHLIGSLRTVANVLTAHFKRS